MRKELIDIVGKAITGVIEQGVPSVDDNGSCSYRGNDGTKCAVGMLINDRHYDKTLEGKTINDLNVTAAVLDSQGISAEGVEIEDFIYYLDKVQRTHDDIARGTNHVNFLKRFKEGIVQHLYMGYLPQELTPVIQDSVAS